MSCDVFWLCNNSLICVNVGRIKWNCMVTYIHRDHWMSWIIAVMTWIGLADMIRNIWNCAFPFQKRKKKKSWLTWAPPLKQCRFLWKKMRWNWMKRRPSTTRITHWRGTWTALMQAWAWCPPKDHACTLASAQNGRASPGSPSALSTHNVFPQAFCLLMTALTPCPQKYLLKSFLPSDLCPQYQNTLIRRVLPLQEESPRSHPLADKGLNPLKGSFLHLWVVAPSILLNQRRKGRNPLDGLKVQRALKAQRWAQPKHRSLRSRQRLCINSHCLHWAREWAKKTSTCVLN